MILDALLRYISIGYWIGLLLVACLSTAIWYTTTATIQAQKSNAVEVNVAGRQRMLVQRLTTLAYALPSPELMREAGLDPAQLQAEMANCTALLEQAHQYLMALNIEGLERSAANGIRCTVDVPEAAIEPSVALARQPIYLEGSPSLDMSMTSFLAGYRQLIARAGSIDETYLEILAALPFEALVDQLDGAVQALQVAVEAQNNSLARFKTNMWLLTLLLLVIELFLIFRPMRTRLKRTLIKLQAAIQRLEQKEIDNHILKESSEAKDRFLMHLNHEFRTPLNAIIGYSEILTAETTFNLTPEQRHEYAKNVLESGRHFHHIFENAIDIAQLETETITLNRSFIDIPALIADSIQSVEAIAAAQNVSIKTNISADLPKLCGDRRRIKQILGHLLKNGLVYNAPGGWVTLTAYQSEGDSLSIKIEDNGSGISNEDIRVITEPFGRALRNPTLTNNGVGLGLPLSSRLAELHGGRLEIESRPGQGTIVNVTLPLTSERFADAPV